MAVAVVAFAPFALGGAPRWATCLAAGLAVIGAALYVNSPRELSGRSPLLIFLGLAAAFTLLQLIPLPEALVGILSPAKRQLILDNAAALRVDHPGWFPISMDPPATAVELAKLVGYTAFAYLCLRLSLSRRRRQWVAIALVGVGVGMAATAVLHNAAGAEKLFGVYAPRFIIPPPYMAPILNPNHLAGLMALLAPIALGLAFALSTRYRAAALAAGLFIAGVGLLTQSRGGAVALLAGLATTGVLLVLHRRRGAQDARRLPLRSGIPMVIVALCALVLIGVISAGGVAEELLGTRTSELGEQASKFGAWRASTNLLDEHAWTGVGRGAFEASFPRYHSLPDTRLYSHLENEYLQAAVDWGIPAAAALAVAFIAVALAAARRCRGGALQAGLFGGLLAIAVHNLVDFNLSLPGVAFPAVAALAILVGGDQTLRATRGLLVRSSAVAIAALAIVFASSPFGRSARADADLLRAPGAQKVPAALHAFARHPSDYMLAGLLAQALYNQGDKRAVGAINRALALNPGHSGLHLLAARMLWDSQNPDQALVEYAIALELQPSSKTLEELISRFPEPERAALGLPVGDESLRRIGHKLRKLGRHDIALAYGHRLAQRLPRDPAVHRFVAVSAEATGQPAVALEAARRAFELEPSPRSVITLARTLESDGSISEALATLRNAIDTPRARVSRTDRIDLLTTLGELSIRAGDLEAARTALNTALSSAEGRAAARIHRHLATVERLSGNVHKARWEETRANELTESQ